MLPESSSAYQVWQPYFQVINTAQACYLCRLQQHIHHLMCHLKTHVRETQFKLQGLGTCGQLSTQEAASVPVATILTCCEDELSLVLYHCLQRRLANVWQLGLVCWGQEGQHEMQDSKR